MALGGGCLCGGVRFFAESIETHFHACHCGMCRRWATFALGREIYIDQKPAGYAFAGDRPRLTEAEVIAQFTAGS